MLLGEKGRGIRDEKEALAFIKEFIRRERGTGEGGFGHSHGYDLYLPWLGEVVLNSPAEGAPLDGHTIERLFMEVSWELVQQGILRPGPRLITTQNTGEAYGKGYSLTHKGDEWLREDEEGERTPRNVVPSVDVS